MKNIQKHTTIMTTKQKHKLKCSVSCSFGEVIDKITILKIKLSKSREINDVACCQNIQTELNRLESQNPLAQTSDTLFEQLSDVNIRLWNLEDHIRAKSTKQEFDETYIELAEAIHKTNDKRCQLKRAINTKYGSEIVEEKIYNNLNFLEQKQ